MTKTPPSSVACPSGQGIDPWRGVETTHLGVLLERFKKFEEVLSAEGLVVQGSFNTGNGCAEFRNEKDEVILRLLIPFGGGCDADIRVMHAVTLPESWKERLTKLLENRIHFLPFPTLTS